MKLRYSLAALIKSQCRATFLSLCLSFSVCLLRKINISEIQHWRCITIHNRWALRCQSVTRHSTCSKSSLGRRRKQNPGMETSGIRITFRIEIVHHTLCYNLRTFLQLEADSAETAQFSWRFARGSYCSSRCHFHAQSHCPCSHSLWSSPDSPLPGIPLHPGLEQKVSVCTKNETKTEIRLHH